MAKFEDISKSDDSMSVVLFIPRERTKRITSPSSSLPGKELSMKAVDVWLGLSPVIFFLSVLFSISQFFFSLLFSPLYFQEKKKESGVAKRKRQTSNAEMRV